MLFSFFKKKFLQFLWLCAKVVIVHKVYLAKFGDIQNMKVKKNLKHSLMLSAIVMNWWRKIPFSKYFSENGEFSPKNI